MAAVIYAGAAIYAGVGAAGFAIGGGAIGAAVLQGALVGALIGAASAAVTGGDIGKGALYGALSGAVMGGAVQAFAGPGSTSAVTNAANADKGVMATMSDTYKQAMVDMSGQAAAGSASQVGAAPIQPPPSQVSGTVAPSPSPVASGPGVYSGTPTNIAKNSLKNAALPGQAPPLLPQPSVISQPQPLLPSSGVGTAGGGSGVAGGAPPGVDANVWAQIQANKDNAALLAGASKKQVLGEMMAGVATPVVGALLQEDPMDDFEARRPQHSGSTYLSRTGRNTDKYKRVG